MSALRPAYKLLKIAACTSTLTGHEYSQLSEKSYSDFGLQETNILPVANNYVQRLFGSDFRIMRIFMGCGM